MSSEKSYTSLSPEAKRALLRQLLQEKNHKPAAFPLSYAQQRLWFLDQLQSGISAYNVPVAVQLSGDLNVAALEQSLTELVARHETLRTTFATDNSQPVQLISRPGLFTLRVLDLGELHGPAQEEEVLRLTQEEATCAFDLEAGPLLRARLLRLSESEHVLLLTMHHIVSDGWSMGVLVRELGALYEAFSQGAETPLTPLEVQYADYAQWQREHLVGEVLEQQLQYWREQLAGAPALLELPADHPRPAVQSFRGARESVRLGVELTAALKELSRAEGVTLFMTLLAGFAVLLWRYTGQRDVVLGTPVANRGRREVEGLIGFFVNTLSLRLPVVGEERFATMLKRVREVCLGGYAHQEVPFERVVEELGVERRLSQSPLFQVMFVLQNAPRTILEVRDLKFKALPSETPTAKFDLSVFMIQIGDHDLTATMEYSTELFERETIERLAGHYQRLLTWLVGHPERPLWEVELLSAEERRLQLKEWNETRVEFAGPALVHELIEQQARRTPEAVALVYENERLFYAELNARANQLAAYLRRQGVGPESLIGILMERSVELVVGLLGVLKAGAAYVPLDPGYPAERLVYMVNDAGASVVLTQERLSGVLPGVLPEQRAQVICVDRDWADIARESPADQASGAEPDNLAYVIYTSGSTGKPKGAMNTQRAVRNRLLWMQREYGLTGADVVLQKTPFSFDVSVWEFFWPLLRGARLVLARPGGHRDGSYLAELIEREKVTTLHFVPSMLRLFVEEENLEQRCGSVRRVFSSGESLSQESARRLRARLPGAGLHNLYGPTEAAVDVSYHEWQEGESGEGVLIGRPIANTQIYVLDERWRPVPLGVKGEIYLGGVGVGRGYWRRPELTAERFVPDPFSEGGRLYRTGDVGRRLGDGEVEYVGRVDQQVKVRGHRIELGEVEAALASHPEIRECAVQALTEEGGGLRLIGYVALNALAAVSVSELRRWLGERLPEYMVPSVIVMLEELPKLPNGKVDRRSLPTVDAARPSLASEYVPPQTEVQRMISGIWREVLGVEQVGINDNFFDLGGHSLKMIEVRNKLKSAVPVSLTLVDLFQYPTIALLAGWISKREDVSPVLTQATDRAETRRTLMRRRQLNRISATKFSGQAL